MTNEYRIAAIKDFLAVPDESIDACLADFKVWLQVARQPKDFSSDMNDLIGVPNALSFSDESFTWLDDGLSGIVHIDIVNAADDSPIGRLSLGEQA